MSSVKAGDVVRIVNVIGADKHENLFAHVLSTSPARDADGEFTDGLPVLSVAFMDPRHRNPAALGSSNWSNSFTRQAGVLHSSHPEVSEGKHSVYWIDVLPNEWPDVDQHPQLSIPGPSGVYSREYADDFFRQNARYVPNKVEGVTVDHTQDPTSAATSSGETAQSSSTTGAEPGDSGKTSDNSALVGTGAAEGAKSE